MSAVLDYSATRVVLVSQAELLSVDDIQPHIRVTNESEFDDLQKKITAARVLIEQHTRRSLIQKTYDFAYDCFPDCRSITFTGYSPLTSVTHLKYIDQDGTLQTWSSANYEVDEPRDTLWLAYNVDWPTIRDIQNAVQIRAVFGHNANDDEIVIAKQAIRLLATHWYEHRGIVGEVGQEIAFSYNALIDQLTKRSYP